MGQFQILPLQYIAAAQCYHSLQGTDGESDADPEDTATDGLQGDARAAGAGLLGMATDVPEDPRRYGICRRCEKQ